MMDKISLANERRQREATSTEPLNPNDKPAQEGEAGVAGACVSQRPLGVLLSAAKPTVTRQLNVLSNIVQRTLIFGGDQELLVLAETLDADRPAFLRRWYGPGGGAAGHGAAAGGPGPAPIP